MTSSLKFRGASTSSSSAHQSTYDVFLSFRGEDTYKNFTCQLYDFLERNGLKTFIDDEQLRRGVESVEIPSALVKAIEESRILIVVLSENYASSAWCLDELTKIIECMETKKQIVVPVFYGVTSSDVRHRKNNIKKSFGKLEERFRDNPEKVERWKTVLRQVGNLPGWNLGDNRLLQINNIIGPIPAELERLSKLYTLDLSDNFFSTGKLPSSLGDLTSLKSLSLQVINSTGPILAELERFSMLQTLDLSGIFFNGDIPFSLHDLIKRNVEHLILSYNSLTRAFPIMLWANSTQVTIRDATRPILSRIQFFTNVTNLQVAKHPVGIESHVQEPDLSSSPSPLGIESHVQEPQYLSSSPSPLGIESLVQEPLLSSLSSGNGEQGNNSSTLSQGVILIFIGLVIGLLQLGNLFETHPVNMWITVAASVMCFLSHAAMTKISGTHWTKYSQTINIFRILSGILAAVSLLSTRLPHQRWWLVFAIWVLLAFIIVAGWIYLRAKRRGVETRIPLSRLGV